MTIAFAQNANLSDLWEHFFKKIKQHCKESISYTSNDIEIFITAYEITASIVADQSIQSTSTIAGPKIDSPLQWTED